MEYLQKRLPFRFLCSEDECIIAFLGYFTSLRQVRIVALLSFSMLAIFLRNSVRVGV